MTFIISRLLFKFLTCLCDGSIYFLCSQYDCLGSILVLSTRHRMDVFLRGFTVEIFIE